MKLSFYQFVIFIVTSTFGFSQESGLPKISAELVSKLDKWEKETRAKVEEDFAEKKFEVAKILQQHLKQVTQSGNLDGALAIRKKIEELTPSDSPALIFSL